MDTTQTPLDRLVLGYPKWKKQDTILTTLKKCAHSRDLRHGKKAHAEAIPNGLPLDISLANALLNMYSKCGRMDDAKMLFKKMSQRDIVSWNVLIHGYVENGESQLAIEMFENIGKDKDRCVPNARTYTAAIMACTSLARKDHNNLHKWAEKGRNIHSRALATHSCNIFVENTLIRLYSKCRMMVLACEIFDNMAQRDIVSWTTLLQGYVENGQHEIALEVFERMTKVQTTDSRAYTSALMACVGLVSRKCEGLKWLEVGKDIHARVLKDRCSDTFTENLLVNAYVKCGCMVDAREVFDKMIKKDVICWTTMLQGYVEDGENKAALELFDSFQGCVPDARVYVSAIMACAALGSKRDEGTGEWLAKGKCIHFNAVRMKCCNNYVENTLIDMYSKCGSLVDARNVFNGMVEKDVISWTSMIQGYAGNGECEEAFELFGAMDCAPNEKTYISVLGLSTGLACDLTRVKSLHAEAVMNDCCGDFLENMLVKVYAQVGCMFSAQSVFDSMCECDVVSWNALIDGYVENRESQLALELFGRMECVADARTYVAVLRACTSNASKEVHKWLEQGRRIHSIAILRCTSDIFIETALIDMYAKCRKMVNAKHVFDSMSEQDVHSWGCLLQGYLDNEESKCVLSSISSMDVAKSVSTYVCALTACGTVLDIERGKALHNEIKRCACETNPSVLNALIHFYGRCGVMECAKKVFDACPLKDTVTCNNLLGGYSQQGDYRRVTECFQYMRDGGIHPNEVTFTHVLTCCSHCGLIEQGMDYFNNMQSKYGVIPDNIHYSCMIDLLARGNDINGALLIVRNMPFEPDGIVWTAILGGCHKSNNLLLGQLACEFLLRLELQDTPAYVLMGNIYVFNS